ncbi:MAG: Flp pilus assembly complex ATPase component TadA [Clostridiales bacterium]|nr:Flp pilus assembly complex ATPase component TadA [Clostridiales bacterium]
MDSIVVPGSICAKLIEQGVITEAQLREALEIQKEDKTLIGKILIRLGYCTEEDVARVLALKTGFDFVSINEIGVNMGVASLISPDMAVKNNILPLYQEGRTLFVAMRNPNDIITIDNLHLMTGYEIRPVVATDTELATAIDNFVNMNNNLDQFNEGDDEREQDAVAAADAADARIDDKPAVMLVNQVINNAIKTGASDIHIEPLERSMRVRLRIDGVLHEIMQNPIKMHAAVISRIKVIGGMDIAERRVPQDGRATVKLDNRTFDIRIAILPTVYGEKSVMRLLERGSKSVTLNDIKFSEKQRDYFYKAIHMPYGFVLVTGPTGSGKSTTLYATLSEVADIEKHVITLEDPVERRMSGICQVQMNSKAGMTFASALRSVLRSDPDIVMVGEIRDGETAKIAVESALTGHMVFSTLHTNDSSGAISRLTEMGVEPYLTTSSLVGVLAQRLVRVLCPRCKEEYNIKMEDLLRIIPDFPQEGCGDEVTLCRPKGCISCNNTGYKGRQGVFEFLRVTDSMRELILKEASTADIKELAISEGMQTLRMEGIDKVKNGITSIEELLRVIA